MHTFSESLKLSQEQADPPWWDEVYMRAFPSIAETICVRSDGWAQRGGIDRVIVLKSGKTLNVDEKVRAIDYEDILLEYWSNKQRRVPGWVAKDLACDFIAYAFIPSKRCYLLPFQTLRLAWRRNCWLWVKKYRRVDAENGGAHPYTTVCVAVPIDVLMAALTDAILVTWEGQP